MTYQLTFDGHFWVVRDGKIIDPAFPLFDKMICALNKCNVKKPKVYLECKDEKVKDTILSLYLLNKGMKSKEELYDILTKDNYKPMQGNCILNAIFEQMKNGGTIVFGSLGYERLHSNDIHYEYGGKDWTTTKDFKVQYNRL